MDGAFLILILILSVSAFYCCFTPFLDLMCKTCSKYFTRQRGVTEAEVSAIEEANNNSDTSSVIEAHVCPHIASYDEEEKGEFSESYRPPTLTENNVTTPVAKPLTTITSSTNGRNEEENNSCYPIAQEIPRLNVQSRQIRNNNQVYPHSDSDD